MPKVPKMLVVPIETKGGKKREREGQREREEGIFVDVLCFLCKRGWWCQETVVKRVSMIDLLTPLFLFLGLFGERCTQRAFLGVRVFLVFIGFLNSIFVLLIGIMCWKIHLLALRTFARIFVFRFIIRVYR